MANRDCIETWRPVEGFKGYEVSDHGRVRSFHRKLCGGPRILAPQMDADGYHRVQLSGRKWKKVHRLVMDAFVGPRLEGMECRHLDDDKTNNRLSNLCWGTHRENMQDSIMNGRQSVGTGQPGAKLTDDKVRSILDRCKKGIRHKLIAEEFGVSRSKIGQIARGENWKHVSRGVL